MAIKSLRISKLAAEKIKSYTAGVEGEVCGLLFVNDGEKRRPIVEDAIILSQESTTGRTNITEDALVKYLAKLAQERPEDIEMVKGWWHSHYDFDVFWSQTDNKTFMNFAKIMPRVYGVVVNQKGNLLGRADKVFNTKGGKKVRVQNRLKVWVPQVNINNKMKKEAGKLVKVSNFEVFSKFPMYVNNYYLSEPYMWAGEEFYSGKDDYYADEEEHYFRKYEKWKKREEARSRMGMHTLWGDGDAEDDCDYEDCPEAETFGNTNEDQEFIDSYRKRRRKLSGVV